MYDINSVDITSDECLSAVLMIDFIGFGFQLWNKYMVFAHVIALQHHTAYMFNVESRRSQVRIQ